VRIEWPRTSRQRREQLRRGGFEALTQLVIQSRRLVALRIGDLPVHGVHAVQDLLCLERRQHRLERVVQRQHVRRATTAGQRQHRLVRQRPLRQQVQQRLERTGERRLIHRRGRQQTIGLLDVLGKTLHHRAVEAGVDQVGRLEIAYGVAHHLHAVALQPVARRIQQHAGARALAGAAGQGNDHHR